MIQLGVPNDWAVYLDGAQLSYEQPTSRPTWISSDMTFPVMWIADGAPVTGGTLPQDLQIVPMYFYCEPGYPCS